MKEVIIIIKVLWLLVIGSFLGYIIETLFCSISKRKFVSRKGLIYTYNSPIYGLALVLFNLLYEKLKRKSIFVIMLVSGFFGSAFEFLCSYLQEKVLGTQSWDYSNKFLNIQGRCCLQYTVYWSLLGLAMLKLVCPVVNRLVAYQNFRSSNIVVIVLAIILIYDCLISVLACARQNNRRKNIPANNKLEIYLDKKFNDTKLDKLFPGTKIIN